MNKPHKWAKEIKAWSAARSAAWSVARSAANDMLTKMVLSHPTMKGIKYHGNP